MQSVSRRTIERGSDVSGSWLDVLTCRTLANCCCREMDGVFRDRGLHHTPRCSACTGCRWHDVVTTCSRS